LRNAKPHNGLKVIITIGNIVHTIKLLNIQKIEKMKPSSIDIKEAILVYWLPQFVNLPLDYIYVM